VLVRANSFRIFVRSNREDVSKQPLRQATNRLLITLFQSLLVAFKLAELAVIFQRQS
jgi:hypothetical protein